LGKHAVEDAAKGEEDEDGDEGRAPSAQEESSKDQVGDEAKDDGAGPDMDGARSADEPGTEAADDPDGGKRGPGLVIPIPEEKCQEDEERDGVSGEVSQVAVEQWAEEDADEAWQGTGNDSEAIQGKALVMAEEEVNELDEKEEGDEGEAYLESPVKRALPGAGHGGVPRRVGLFPTDADGLGEATEERWAFLGGGGGGQGFAGRRTIRAEKAGLTTLDTERTDAIAAEGLFALCAFDHGGDAGVEQAGERTVEEVGLDGLGVSLEFGDRDADRVGLFFHIDAKFSGAEAEDLSGFQNRLLHGVSIDEGAVGGVEVPDEDGVAADDEFAVEAGDGGVVDAIIVGGISAEADQAVSEFKCSRMSDPG
jgi:hypothetical protein